MRALKISMEKKDIKLMHKLKISILSRLNRELLTTQVLPEKEEPSGVHGLVRRILNAFSQEVAPLNTSLP